jgi:hypothetical protein
MAGDQFDQRVLRPVALAADAPRRQCGRSRRLAGGDGPKQLPQIVAVIETWIASRLDGDSLDGEPDGLSLWAVSFVNRKKCDQLVRSVPQLAIEEIEAVGKTPGREHETRPRQDRPSAHPLRTQHSQCRQAGRAASFLCQKRRTSMPGKSLSRVCLIALSGMLLGLSVVAAATPGPHPAPNLNQRVLASANSRVGHPTADPGLTYSCANFVAWVLHQTGAKSTENYGISGPNPNLNYVWGQLVVQHNASGPLSAFNAVQPGDVIQFRNVALTLKTTHPNGSWSTRTVTMQQHTAIVAQNQGNGRFVVLEQNYNHQSFVTRDPLNLSGMTSGTVWVYRPVAK